ncbi:RNA-directed DNA polymerase, eukaryota [Artemisia annua]|uniref:RNA-directed DNA polymerase, eukaryota n=1 Tax=Artemisia annua TaxID=35608 RepID=A0A2U1QBF5_ARTAN|nr:RNA-directed DNA polymerase, eukaryota [Artemisia annua]
MGVAPLQHQFPRLFRLEVNQDCMVRDRWNDGWNWIWSRPISGGITSTQLSTLTTLLDPIILTEGRDEWVWLLDPNNGFIVRKTCIHLDNASLPDAYISTRWCRFIPKKVNIFVWRALRDRLPTRWNLSNKGVEIESILCPSCSSSPETIHHLLWTCSLTTCVWLKVFSWLDLPYPTPSYLQDVFAYVDHLHIHNDRKLMLQAIFGVVLWTLWSFRNRLIFNSHPMARNEIFDKVTSASFLCLDSSYQGPQWPSESAKTFSLSTMIKW